MITWPGLFAIEIKNNMFTGLFIASFHPEGMEIPETIPFPSGIAQLGSGEGAAEIVLNFL